jgi:hypothetical protein
MGGECSELGTDEKCMHSFGRTNLRVKINFEVLGVDNGEMLKWIINKWVRYG